MQNLNVMKKIIHGKEYSLDEILRYKCELEILNNENRLAREYINRSITQNKVDNIGIRNFDDARTLINKNYIKIVDYEHFIYDFNTNECQFLSE